MIDAASKPTQIPRGYRHAFAGRLLRKRRNRKWIFKTRNNPFPWT